MRVESERMYLYPLSDEEMCLVIEKESDPEMKQAYTEMLEKDTWTDESGVEWNKAVK